MTYADGRQIRTRAVGLDTNLVETVRAELAALDESAEVVVLDERGHRLERWCRRGTLFVRDWALPGVVARSPRLGQPSSSTPPPLGR